MKAITIRPLVAMLGLCAIFTFTACEKDDATPDVTKTLTDGKWQMTAITSDPPIDWFGTLVTDIFAQLPACVKDDFTIFNHNGTVHFDEGASKCEQNAPQTIIGTWALNPDKTVLSVTKNGVTESWEIKALKNGIFTIDFQVEQEGLKYKFTVVFKQK